MNNDLISRSRLRKNMEFICMGIMAGTEPYNAPLTEIDNAPTVEIATKLQPNCNNLQPTQGEWIRTGSLGNGNAQYECSNCHYGDEQAESQEVPYCWHCGAKMQKGGAKNEKTDK